MTVKNLVVGSDAEKTPNLAAKLVQEASKFESKIYIEDEDLKINVKSIMGMMSLSISAGRNIKITAEGDDEIIALNAISDYLCKAV